MKQRLIALLLGIYALFAVFYFCAANCLPLAPLANSERGEMTTFLQSSQQHQMQRTSASSSKWTHLFRKLDLNFS
nr:hypothetical protein [uncultured Ruegeria sp.]